MLGQLAQAGLDVIEDERAADAIIVNTCGFIDTAKAESINTIIELGALKRRGRCTTLIATGCLTQRYQGELLNELPELDAIVGTGDFPRIAEIITGRLAQASPDARREWFEHPTFLYDASTPRRRLGPRHWAYVKISEGCDKRCAFCAIPSFRGDLASRTIDSVVREATALAADGVREVNLIAQDLPAFGMDRGRKGELIDLVRALNQGLGVTEAELDAGFHLLEILRRHDAFLDERVTGEQFDSKPDAELVFVGPDAAHLRARVALNHGPTLRGRGTRVEGRVDLLER